MTDVGEARTFDVVLAEYNHNRDTVRDKRTQWLLANSGLFGFDEDSTIRALNKRILRLAAELKGFSERAEQALSGNNPGFSAHDQLMMVSVRAVAGGVTVGLRPVTLHHNSILDWTDLTGVQRMMAAPGLKPGTYWFEHQITTPLDSYAKYTDTMLLMCAKGEGAATHFAILENEWNILRDRATELYGANRFASLDKLFNNFHHTLRLGSAPSLVFV